ncbi:DUF11 domain-containing protein [Methanobrevibacter ruminantium]|nr:DUF11 domain-containing protein [Methanobrevibacter ruminantium]
MLFIIIFSISFVSANENVTNDVSTNELSTQTVSNDITTSESISDTSLDSGENRGLDEIKSNSTEESSSSNLDLEDGTLNNDEIESDDCLTKNGKEATLQANKLSLDINMSRGTAQDVLDAIVRISSQGGGTLYLNGGTYTEGGHARVYNNDTDSFRNIVRNDGIVDISNVRVVGGSVDNPNQYATFQPNTRDSTSLAFSGYGVWDGNGTRYYPDSGFNLTNVTFENLNCTGRFFSFNSGYLTDCVFNNLESYQHLFFVTGAYNDGGKPIVLTNCNFTNSKQTYRGDGPGDGTDGTGQFGVVFGAEMYGCNFINTSTATHGGAFCLSDEWISAACVPSKLVDCNFINITSRWFAVYIHGNYSNTTRFITEPQVVENCSFINCTATGEFGGALGISHNNVIINNTEFIHNVGGKGSAIMVGGINNTHDGFLGVNTQGNNITIYNCTFEDNIAKIEGQSSAHSTDPPFTTYPTGYGGAVYVYGNHTKIIDSTFNNNTADDSCGAAIYIRGDNTTVVNSEFYNHTSENGTIYLVGNDCKIKDSLFHDNDADSTGACIFVEGNRAEIGNTTFVNNTAPNGGCVFIIGDHTLVDNDTKFITNNATNGAGIYVNGSNTMILNTSFINNTAVNGSGAFIYGHDTDVNGSYFEGNDATNGGAVFIEGNINDISNNTFLRNNATNQGGAVYIDGNHTKVNYNNFTENEAIPISEDQETGLGGAIFIRGNDTNTTANTFLHNKARNGSAIYTDGTNFYLHNDHFLENQAWSYLLITTADPAESLYKEQDIEINVLYRAGDNIINAIHNRNKPNETHFMNVTYSHSEFGNITTSPADQYVEPVDGVENSREGELLYQDDRENYQQIELRVEHENGDLALPRTPFRTNIYGNVNTTLNKSSLRKGLYVVGAEHIEDWNYKFIMNSTSFRILDTMDIMVNKTSDKEEYFQDEIAEWELIFHNTDNGTDAENVTMTDHLPNVFELMNLSYMFYTPTEAITNATLYLNNNTLRYGVYNSSSQQWVYGDARYNASANSWTYYFFDYDNVTYVYTEFNADDFVPVFGPVIYSNSTDVCYDNISYNIPEEDWYYDTIMVNGQEVRYGHFNATEFEQYFGPSYYDEDNKTWVWIHRGEDPLNPGQETDLRTIYDPESNIWVIDDYMHYPERKTVTEKVVFTIVNDTANNLTHLSLYARDFDVNVTGYVNFTTNCTRSGDYTNVVNVTTPDYDWDLSNNVANRSVLVDPLPNKTVSNTTPYYHDYVDYNLTIMNTGNSTYDQILTVVDSLPEGLVYNTTVGILYADQIGETLVENQGRTVTWNVTNIPANTNATIIVRVYVDALGNLTNNMTLIAPSGDNRTVNATITPVTYTDVSVNKTVEKEEYFINDTIVWTITVSVAGNGSNATNVNLSDVLPPEVEYISTNGTYDNATNSWYIGNMTNGSSVSITIDTRAIRVAENVTNVANVSCNETEWDYENNRDNATVSIIPVPQKTVNETNPTFGKYVDYNLTIINNGAEPYTDTLTVVDNLPEGLAYNNTVSILYADQVGDTIVENNNRTITWYVTNIPANTNATIIVRVYVGILGEQINNYTLIGPKGSNRTVNASIVVEPKVDISVEKTSDKINYFEGETVIWTITVSNANNATPATNVTLKDILPEEVEFVSANDTYSNETGIWYIGDMANGTSRTIVINTTAIRSKTNVTNVASVNCTEKEWNYTNNVDNATINIYPLINKTVSNSTPDYGDEVEYNLTVINTGDVMFNETVTLVDRLPEGVDFIKVLNEDGLKVISFDHSTKNLTWVVTNISANTKATITILANCTLVGLQENTWTIYGPEGMNRTVNATIVVGPKVDVSVEKTSDKINYFEGETVIWTITVHNANNGTNATNVTLKDILPEEVLYVSSNGTYNNNTGIWYIGNMTNGSSRTIVINTTAIKSKANVTNVANVSCNETEWNYTNNVDDAVINIYPLINKTVSNPTPDYHEEIEYNLTVENTGDIMFNETVTLVDRLPIGVDFIKVVNVTGLKVISFDNTTKNLTWNVTNITAHTKATITILAVCNAIGVQDNTWTIYGPEGMNRTVNATIEVKPIVDVSITKVADQEIYHIGDNVTWIITVHNAWNGTNATNVNVNDILPKEVEYLTHTVTQGQYNNRTGIWTIGFMANGTSQTLTIVSVAKINKTDITNVANVSCSEKEWNYSNNRDYATIEIVDTPINKTASKPVPDYHEEIEYYLTVTNLANETYNKTVTLVDSLPEGVTFLRVVNETGLRVLGFERRGNHQIWNVTDIEPNTTAVITILARCDAVGTKINNWTIYYPNGDSETVNATIEVKPIVDVSITKVADQEIYHIGDNVTWIITVHNAWNGTNATNVNVNDILPKEVEYLTHTVTQGQYNNRTGIWTIGFMANGTSQTLTIVSVAKINKTDITNVANVSCSEKEWNYSNNRDNATIEIVDTPINKTASKPVPDYHEEIEYYLTVTNLANETYNKTVTLVDSLPEGVTFLRVVNTSGLRVLSFNSTEKVQTWTVTDIEANTTAVITILARCDAVGIEINNWTIYYPNGDSKKVETPIDVQPIVDLSTTKTSNKDVYFLDDTAVWTITVHNAWNGTNATNVVIDELFPSEFEIINYTTTKGRYDPSARAWTIDFMENGTTETLVITSVATVVTPFVDNPVNVTSDERDWNLSNNPSNKSVKVIDIPDPEKTVNNATPYYNDTVVYSLTIKNTGDIKYTNKLTVIDSMPQGLEYVKTVGISGAKLIKEVVKGQVITWTITNISAHSNAVIKVRVRAKALGNLTNNLTIVTPHANKTVNCTITPVPIADLAVTKTNDHYGKDCLNSTFVYWTIKVVNYGPNTAVNAIAKDILPEGIIYLSDDSDGAYDYETGIWTIGNLAKGKSVTMTIETIVDAIDTRINNKVVVSSDTYDPDKSNNRDNSSIKVISIADLKLTKTANVTKTYVGENFTYTITVVNLGPDTAVNSRVYDVLPKGVKLLSFNESKGSYNPQTGKWAIGDMALGEEVTLKVNVRALTTGKIVNEARVESDTYDNDTSNNNDSATVIVIGDNPPIKMLPTGNPILIALLSLLAIVGVTLRRKS